MSFRIQGNQIYLDGRHIGWVTKLQNGKKIYVSPRNRMGITKDGSGHFFERWKGFGLAVSVYEFLKRNGFDEVHLKIGRAETLISSLDTWEQWGIPYHKEPYEKQIILPEKHMMKHELSLAELMH